MGLYINPKDMSKEEWLHRHGILAKRRWEDYDEDKLPVVLVDNIAFTAAGVCYSKDEFEAFTCCKDSRSKFVYEVPIEDIREVTEGELDDYFNGK